MSESVEVSIGGQRLLVSSDHAPDYTRAVAAHFDAAYARIRSALPTVDMQRAAILAGLAVTDELFQVRRDGETSIERIRAIEARLSRLLPPGRRGGRPTDSGGREES
ncbi:MAG: cell division protein ZapA [Gemmatimonadetes bacterium]|nr:cell division protein ZapA [Gemmatimonadota bacterium]